MKDRHFYKVMYRVKVQGIETDWSILVLDQKLYYACIEAPSAQTALHWRGCEVGQALAKIESDICKVVDLKVTEITIQEAYETHLKVCEKCISGEEDCYSRKKLYDLLENEPIVLTSPSEI